jgi:phytoene dehydrogenase-like protein
LVGELWNRGGGDERSTTMVVELWWQLEFMFEAKLAWGGMGEVHPSLYKGVEESGSIKI